MKQKNIEESFNHFVNRAEKREIVQKLIQGTCNLIKIGLVIYPDLLNANQIQQQLEFQTQNEEPDHLAKLVKVSEI